MHSKPTIFPNTDSMLSGILSILTFPNLIIQSTSKEELTKKLSSMFETISTPSMSNMLADENS